MSLLRLASIAADKVVYAKTIAAPTLVMSTIHKRISLPNHGAKRLAVITNMMAFFGVPYFGERSPNQLGRLPSLAIAYISLEVDM